MSLTRAIAGNTAIQIIGKLASTILGIATVAVMTRHLSPAGYGDFTTVISFLQFFGILVDFGLTLTMIRMISETAADETRIASNIFTLRLVSGLVFFGLAPVVALFVPNYSADVRAGIAIGTLSFMCITLSQVLSGIFQKHLAVVRMTLAEIAGRLTLLLGAIAAAALQAGMTAFVLAVVVGNVVQFGFGFISARRFTRLTLAFDRELWKKIIAVSWPIGVSIAFNLIYLKGDVVILSIFREREEIGLYGAAYKVLDVVTVVPMAFMGLVLPVLTAAWSAGNRADFNRKLGRAFDFMSILALPLALGAWFVGTDLMKLVAGPDFADSGRYLAILMLAGASVFWSGLYGHAAVALNLQRKMIWGYAFDAAISLGLYFWLIPRYGAIAAAWITVFSEALIAVITGAVVAYTVKAAPRLNIFARAAAASAVMAASLAGLSPFPVLLRIVAGMAVYALALYLLGGITKETLDSLRKQEKLTTPG